MLKNLITVKESSQILGVKSSTLYAYVSRGLLKQYPNPKGRGSLYLLQEIEELKKRSLNRYMKNEMRHEERSKNIVETAITKIENENETFKYRGYDALELALKNTSYENVAELLWRGNLSAENIIWHCDTIGIEPEKLNLLNKLTQSPLHLMQFFVTLFSISDFCSYHFTLEGEIKRAQKLMKRLAALSGLEMGNDYYLKALTKDTLAETFLSSQNVSASKEKSDAINKAFVLCADHAITPASIIVQNLATTETDLYTCIGGGIAALMGPGQCIQPNRIECMLLQLDKYSDVKIYIQECMRSGENIWGFSKLPALSFFPDVRKRSLVLLDLARQIDAKNSAVKSISNLAKIILEADGSNPSVDAGLYALCSALKLNNSSIIKVFTISRTAGWIAHYLEQRQSKMPFSYPQVIYK